MNAHCHTSPTGTCQRAEPCKRACDLRVQPASPQPALQRTSEMDELGERGTMKPRLRLNSGAWRCWPGVGPVGWGKTPKEAYENWTAWLGKFLWSARWTN